MNYSTQNGTSLSITGVGSSGSSLGSVGVNPSVSTTYNATVTGPGGTGNCSAALTVQKANQTFQVGADCNGSFCAADQATADQYCVQQGFGSAANFQSYPVTQSNPNNGGVYTGNEAWWNGSGWGYAWGGQCNAGGGCTPENGYEIYQATCQASVPATPATPSQGQVNQLPSP